MPEAEPDQETSLQDQPQLNTGDEGRDGPDVKEDIWPKLESIYTSEVGPDPEADIQELAQPKTESEGRDGSDVKGEVFTKTRNHLHARSKGRESTWLKDDELKSCKLLSGILIWLLKFSQ